MSEYDNTGKAAAWAVSGGGPKSPVLRLVVNAHRDIQQGEEFEIALWENNSQHPRAPKYTGQAKDKYVAGEQEEAMEEEVPF